MGPKGTTAKYCRLRPSRKRAQFQSDAVFASVTEGFDAAKPNTTLNFHCKVRFRGHIDRHQVAGVAAGWPRRKSLRRSRMAAPPNSFRCDTKVANGELTYPQPRAEMLPQAARSARRADIGSVARTTGRRGANTQGQQRSISARTNWPSSNSAGSDPQGPNLNLN